MRWNTFGQHGIKALLLSAALTLPSCTSAPKSATTKTATTTASTAKRHEVTAPASLAPVVEFDTSMGSFELTLDADAAPVTTMNFMDYAKSGYYTGTVFHRVVAGTMIQGGGYYASMHRKDKGLRDPIISEWTNAMKNTRWSVGMVRRPGVVDSAQSEFYINLVDDPVLDTPADGAGYCIFGRVTGGFDTLEAIQNVPVGTHPRYAGGKSAVVPKTPILVKSVRVKVHLDRAAAIVRAREQADARKNVMAHLIASLEARGGHKAVKTDSGLTIVDLVVGNGGVPEATSSVLVYYRGYFPDGTEFENYMRNSVTLKMENLTPGLREGILGMTEGGSRAIIIPPDLAFGSGGIPGKIPPNSTLVFEVQLLEVK